jgi:hypothetical protein
MRRLLSIAALVAVAVVAVTTAAASPGLSPA